MFIDWKDSKVESLLKFRDQVHESVFGSGKGEPLPTAWWDNFDDGYEAYVNPKPQDEEAKKKIAEKHAKYSG